MTNNSLYSVTYPGGVKPLKDAPAVRRWASENTGIGVVNVWGFSPSSDGYVWLQTLKL